MRRYQRGFWNFVIPAVAGLAGSLLSSKSNKDATASAAQAQADANAANIENQRQMNEANIAAQKEFAQHGVSWKVQDAKDAGLHPLFGAGLTGASFSPSFQASDIRALPTRAPQDFSWLAQVGQLLGNFLGGSQESKRVQAAAAAAPSDQTVTFTEYPDGTRTIVKPISTLESQVSGRPLDPPLELVEAYGQGPGVPRQLRTDPLAKDWITSPVNAPFWQRFSFGSGFNVILPKTSEPQEVFEDKPLWFWAMVAKANVKEYGPGWLTQARHQFPSFREVYDAVVRELKSSGIIDALPSVQFKPPWR